MEINKIIISCPKCGKLIRIPSDKHIKFSCPQCSNKYEYKYGIEVGNSKKRKVISILLLVLLILGLLIWLINRAPNVNYPNISDAKAIDSSSIKMPNPNFVDTTSNQYASKINDTTDNSLNEFKKALKDKSLDILKDILDKNLDEINKETANGNWEEANSRFEKTTETMKKSGSNGKALLKLYQGKLAKTKNYILSKNPNPNSLPNIERINNNRKTASHATEFVTNSTSYILTLYYSGPNNFIVTIPPGGERPITLLKGSYSIVASVNASLVKDYYGSRIYEGSSYSIKYYIVTTSY